MHVDNELKTQEKWVQDPPGSWQFSAVQQLKHNEQQKCKKIRTPNKIAHNMVA